MQLPSVVSQLPLVLMDSTLVIVDTTFVRHLESPASHARINSAMRAANLSIHPTATNVLEVLAIPQLDKRQRYIASLKDFLGNRALLPAPTDVLREVGVGLRNRLQRTWIDGANPGLLSDDPVVSAAHHERAKATAAKIETVFQPIIADRQLFQQLLKKSGLRKEWSTIPEFLASEWSSPDNLEHLVTQIWEGLGLEDSPPEFPIVWQNESWRIALEAIGATIFERAVRFQQLPNLPGVVDMLQLIYLSFNSRARIFVTGDDALCRVADAVLTGRYPNVRVISSGEFLDRAA